jgi:beta-N-acetylhexosaminidase
MPRPTVAPSPTGSTATSCASETLAAMTEAQRIGQLFSVGLDRDRLDAASKSAILHSHFGSVWLRTKTSVGVDGVRDLTQQVQALATDATTDGVRFFIAANQEGGLVQAVSGPGFDTIPSALAQGELPASALEERASRWGSQLRAAGINLDFAPVADVVPPGADATNAPIGQLRREYGHDPTTVATHVGAFIRGMTDAGIATTAKHFPGLGRVVGNTDFTSQVVDGVTTTDDPYLQPFATAIDDHVPFVMASLATYERIDPDHLAALSPAVMRTLLRDDLGFRGVIMSDSLTAKAVSAIPAGRRAIDFIEAGGDLIVVGPIATGVAMADALVAEADNSPAFRKLIDAAALRVLAAKRAAGLFDCAG